MGIEYMRNRKEVGEVRVRTLTKTEVTIELRPPYLENMRSFLSSAADLPGDAAAVFYCPEKRELPLSKVRSGAGFGSALFDRARRMEIKYTRVTKR